MWNSRFLNERASLLPPPITDHTETERRPLFLSTHRLVHKLSAAIPFGASVVVTHEYTRRSVSVGLELSAHKCSNLRFGSSHPGHEYRIGNAALPLINEVRDLGAIISDTLSFSSHVMSIAKRSSLISSWIMRAFSVCGT